MLAIAALSGCSKDFLDKPPESAVTDQTFYKNDDQLKAATRPFIQ